MRTKRFDLEAGKLVAILHEKDRMEFGIQALDRIEIFNPKMKKRIVTIVDVTKTMVKPGEIGLFKDVYESLGIRDEEILEVKAIPTLETLKIIKKKLDGLELSAEEIRKIVADVGENRIDDIELSAFMTAVFIHGFSLRETVAMTKSMIENGETIKFGKGKVVDKHSIGGVNGRATMIVVPIICSQGLLMPKTSSRSITSSAGTADAMEVLCNVNLGLNDIRRITEKVGGVISWGGAVDLAPVDDKIIKVEHPLSLDPDGQVIASVMAKKASVGAKYLVIDIPVGPEVKVKSRQKAEGMARKFIEVGKQLGIKVEVVLTDGTEPSGKAFGPALEARYAMQILEGKFYDNLGQKGCELAGTLLELAGKARKGKGIALAKKILKSGIALKKMREIIKAQGGKIFSSEEISVGKHTAAFYSKGEGEISKINVRILSEAARIAGAPADKGAGILLAVEANGHVREKQLLFTVYADNAEKLEYAKKFCEKNNPIELEEIILEKLT